MSDKKNMLKNDKILFVFFSDNFFYENKSDFLSRIKKDKFFAESQETILPLPDDVPSDIPVMFLARKGDFEIKFSKSRIDFVKTFPVKEEKFIEHVKQIFNFISASTKHIGMVIYSSSSEINDNEFAKIQRLFSSNGEDIFGVSTSHECFLRTLNQESLDFASEKHVKINKSLVIGTNKSNKLLTTQFDINTFPEGKIEIDNRFTKYFINHTFKVEKKFSDDLLKKVFHNEQ